MTRYLFSHRVQLLGLSLIGLLALIVVLLAQAGSPAGLEIGRPAARSQPAAGTANIDPLADVHPADRKFFTGNYMTTSATSAGVQPAAEAADHKLQDPGYLETLTSQIRVNPLADVHPADRKFFTGNYVTASSADMRALAGAEAADRKLRDPSYLETLAAQIRVAPLANVHPADRKFFTGNYVTTSATSANVQSAAEAADHKLQDPGYLETLMEQIRVDPLASVHPADRKFFTNGYIWTAPSGEEGVGSD